MTHTYALKRLLEHGGLTLKEAVQITGWKYEAVQSALQSLIDTELVVAQKISAKRNIYRLA
jgi:predicted transcriptional regulator